MLSLNKISIFVLVVFISLSSSKAEWKFQKFQQTSNKSIQTLTSSMFFDKNNQKIYLSQSTVDSNNKPSLFLIQTDPDELSKQIELFNDTSAYDSFVNFDLFQSNIVSINPIKGLQIYNLQNFAKQVIKVNDEYDNKLIVPIIDNQKTREYGQMLIQNDTIFFTSQALIVCNTKYINVDHSIMKQMVNSTFELWKYYDNKIELIYKSNDSDGSNGINAYDLKRDENNNFLLGVYKDYTMSNFSSIIKISNDKQIRYLAEHDSIKSMDQANCISLIAKDTKIFARYLGDNKIGEKYNPIFGQFVIYENSEISQSLPLFDPKDGNDGMNPLNKFKGLISYKDYIFVIGKSNIYIYKDSKLSKINVFQNKDLDSHGPVIINDKGIFIVDNLQQGILYNRNIDELIATSGIDQEIDNKEYFTVSNSTINFSKVADSYMIYDINAKLYESKSNPSIIESMPDLANGTYFILAKYGNLYLSEKILISK